MNVLIERGNAHAGVCVCCKVAALTQQRYDMVVKVSKVGDTLIRSIVIPGYLGFCSLVEFFFSFFCKDSLVISC